MEWVILLVLFLRCLQMTPALAITKDASAEDKVRAQFVVAIAKISTGLTWAPPEDGRRGAAVRCVAIAASKVARAAIGAFSCGKLGIVCSVPRVQFNACSPYRELILMNLFLVKSGRFSEEDLAKLRNSSEEDLAKMVDTAIDPVKASHMVYDVWFDEDSYRERCKFKKHTPVEAKECLHVAYTGASLPVQKRKYYPGSNHGKHWGMLVLDPVCKFLQVPHGKKKLYYGSSMRPGGGPPDDEQIDAPDGSSGETITANTITVTDDASGDGKESCDNESSAPPSEGEP